MRSIIICVLLTAAIKTSAQINIICPLLTDSTLNYFYIGVDNPIEIVGLKITPEHKIAISGEGSTVFSGKESKYTPGNSIFTAGENRYIVRTRTYSDSCFILIYKGKKEIFRKRFISRAIPYPDLTVATKARMDGKTISRDTLLRYPFLSATPPGSYLKDCYQVVSFYISVEIKDSVLSASATGSQFSAEQVELIRNAGKSSFLTIENIRALCPDGRTRKLPPFWIKIE